MESILRPRRSDKMTCTDILTLCAVAWEKLEIADVSSMIDRASGVSVLCVCCCPVERNNQKAHQGYNELLFRYRSRELVNRLTKFHRLAGISWRGEKCC